jgi:hypothetical protein
VALKGKTATAQLYARHSKSSTLSSSRVAYRASHAAHLSLAPFEVMSAVKQCLIATYGVHVDTWETAAKGASPTTPQAASAQLPLSA